MLFRSVSAGDATGLVASQSLVAVTDLSNDELLSDVDVNPSFCTPNGDGTNDEVAIRATVFSVREGGRLRVELFDLSGRRLRDLSEERTRPSGEYDLRWDGRDGSGQRVPPGSYLLRIKLEVDAREREHQIVRLVQVAY